MSACYRTSLYVIDFKCALICGEAHLQSLRKRSGGTALAHIIAKNGSSRQLLFGRTTLS